MKIGLDLSGRVEYDSRWNATENALSTAKGIGKPDTGGRSFIASNFKSVALMLS